MHIGVIVISSNGDLVILHPATPDAAEAAALLPPGERLIVPKPKTIPQRNDFRFIIEGPSGFFELLVIASSQPLRNAFKGLQNIAKARGSRSGDPLSLQEDEPVSVMDSLLGDLDSAARAGVGVVRGVQAVDSKKLAALAAIIEVVD